MNWKEDKQMSKGKKVQTWAFVNFYGNPQNMSIHDLE